MNLPEAGPVRRKRGRMLELEAGGRGAQGAEALVDFVDGAVVVAGGDGGRGLRCDRVATALCRDANTSVI